jgi:hypothetical protein
MSFPCTHASKTQKINHKMNVIQVNLEKKHGDECKYSFSLWINDFFHSSKCMDDISLNLHVFNI